MKKILSISGGGMRGVVPARFLIEIERRTNQLISTTFDMSAGTSTGSILATVANAPTKISAEEMMKFYYERGPEIFPKKLFPYPLKKAKYNVYKLADEIRGVVGDFRLRDIEKKLLIPTLCADTFDATFIKSWYPEFADMHLWAAATASSSAQTYFQGFQYNLNGETKRFFDGGNFNNNPAASVLFEGFRVWPGEQYVLVHLGTGKQTNPVPLPDGGLVDWAPLIFSTTTEGQDDITSYYCKYVPAIVKLFSFDISIDKFPAIDDCSKNTLDRLVYLTEQKIMSEENKWKELVDFLIKI